MTLYYSKTTNGFYADDIHEAIPADAVEITPEQHRELLDSQATGKIITSDAEGNPISTDRVPTAEERGKLLNGQALAALAASDITVMRCYESGVLVPAELVAYRDALRKVVGGKSTVLPTPPGAPAVEGLQP